jgi:diguanylate cyclase (GGDEF)-like protein
MIAVSIKTSVIEDLDTELKNGLTGLLNYQTFREHLEQEIERARRTRQVLALMAVSIDELGKFNEKFNYFWGDYALRKLSKIVRAGIREYDLMCRYSEHSLMVALPNLDRPAASLVAERLRSSVSEYPLKSYDQKTEIYLPASVGVAFCPGDSDEINTLVKMAKQALRKSHETEQAILSWGTKSDRTLPDELFHVKARSSTVANPWDALLKEFLWLSLVIIAETFQVEKASLITTANGSKRLKIESARGISKAVMRRIIAGSGGIIGEVMRSEQSILVEDIEKDPRFRHFSEAKLKNYKTKSFMSIPVRYCGQITGVVNLADKESGDGFTEEDLNLATSLIEQIGRAIGGRRLLYVDAIAEMLSIVQDTRPYWKGHSKRVARYAKQIANLLELGEKRAEQIEKLGLLHDLGDIKLAPHIFSKRGELSESEWEQIRQLSLINQRICRSISFLRPYEEAIVNLRKEPGKIGYPGNGNGELSDSARIIAIAEAFDAMTSERPHRPRMDLEEAIDELYRSAKTWLDERVINALQSVLDAVGEGLNASHTSN